MSSPKKRPDPKAAASELHFRVVEDGLTLPNLTLPLLPTLMAVHAAGSGGLKYADIDDEQLASARAAESLGLLSNPVENLFLLSAPGFVAVYVGRYAEDETRMPMSKEICDMISRLLITAEDVHAALDAPLPPIDDPHHMATINRFVQLNLTYMDGCAALVDMIERLARSKGVSKSWLRHVLRIVKRFTALDRFSPTQTQKWSDSARDLRELGDDAIVELGDSDRWLQSSERTAAPRHLRKGELNLLVLGAIRYFLHAGKSDYLAEDLARKLKERVTDITTNRVRNTRAWKDANRARSRALTKVERIGRVRRGHKPKTDE